MARRLRCTAQCGNEDDFVVNGWVQEEETVRVTRNATFYLNGDGEEQDADHGEVTDSDVTDCETIDSDYDEVPVCNECGAEAEWWDDDEEEGGNETQNNNNNSSNRRSPSLSYVEGGIEYG